MELPLLSVSSFIERLPKYFTISIASKRNSGKSYAISAIIKELLKRKKVDLVLVMSGSAGLNNDYNFLPKKLVINFNEEILKNLWAKQVATPEEKRHHILLVLDDCLSDKSAVNSQTVQSIFTLGRHCFLSCIVASQVSSWLLSPTIKQNSDMILWSKLNRQQLETLWSSTSHMDRKEFIDFSEHNGGFNYQFCGIDNFTKSNKPEDFLFVLKA